MRFPFLAAEYTNICAFATFSKSSAVELLTEPKVLRPCGRPPRPGSGRCAGVSPLPSAVPPDPSPLRLAVPRLTAARTSGPCRDPATPVAVGLPVAGNVCTFPHLASWSARIVLAVGSPPAGFRFQPVMPRRRPSKARKIGDFPPFRQPPARCDGVKTPMKTAPRFPTGYPVSARSFSLTLKSRILASSQPWTPGTGGAQPPVRGSVATVPWIW